MKRLASVVRFGRKFGSFCLLFAGAFALAGIPALAASPAFETIRATWSQAGNTVGVTLIIYNYTTSADLRVLSAAFQSSQDQGLAAALSKTKAVGRCSLTGDPTIDVAFIQMVETPTGRQIIFIANRPLQHDEVSTSPGSQSFDLMVGEFDMNDTDNTKSTGFLYPASKLVVDEQGESHYDLAGSPLPLDNIFDSSWVPPLAASQAPDVSGLPSPSSPPQTAVNAQTTEPK